MGEVNPTGAATGTTPYDNTLDGWVPQGWWDEEQGVDATNCYEYASYRDHIKASGSTPAHWGPFTTPIARNHWGQDGRPGTNGEIPAALYTSRVTGTAVAAPVCTAANYMAENLPQGWSKTAPNRQVGYDIWMSQNVILTAADGTYSLKNNAWSTPVRISGDNGTSPYVADITNEMDSVACDDDGHPTSQQSVGTVLNMFHGSADASFRITSVKRNSSTSMGTGVTLKIDGSAASLPTGYSTQKTLQVTYATTATVVKDDFEITMQAQDDSSVVRTLHFTVNGVKPGGEGNDAVIYNLLPSADHISAGRTDAGAYTPSTGSLTCGYTKNVGGVMTTVADVTGQIDSTYNIYFRKRNRSNKQWQTSYYLYYNYKSSTNETYRIQGFDLATWDCVEFILCTGTGNSITASMLDQNSVIDRETVPVVADGMKGDNGTSPWIADLDNEMDSVACDVDGHPEQIGGNNQSVTTNFKLYHGSTAEEFYISSVQPSSRTGATIVATPNTQAEAATSGSLTVTYEGDPANTRATIDGKDEFVVTLTAKSDSTITRQLTFTVNGVRPGANGEPAVICQLKPSMSSIPFQRLADNTLYPASQSVGLTILKTVGGTPTEYSTAMAAGVTVRYSTSAMPASASAGTSWTSGNIAVANTASNLYIAMFELSGTLLDRETIPVIKDGLKGVDGNYYKDEYGRASSRNLNGQGTPSGLDTSYGTSGWSSSAPAATSTYPYIWKRSRLWNPNTSDWVSGSAWIYVCLTGEDGSDGWTITVNPSPIILNQAIKPSSNPQTATTTDFGLPMNIAITAKHGGSAGTVVIDSNSIDAFTGLYVTRHNSDDDILVINSYTPGTNVPTKGVITCNATLTDGTSTVTVPVSITVAINMLGSFVTTIEGDVEESVATKIQYGYDNYDETGLDELETIGKYIRSSEESVSTLTTTVNGHTAAISEIRQTSDRISMSVGGWLGNLLADTDFVSGSMTEWITKNGSISTSQKHDEYNSYYGFVPSGSSEYDILQQYLIYNADGIRRISEDGWFTLSFWAKGSNGATLGTFLYPSCVVESGTVIADGVEHEYNSANYDGNWQWTLSTTWTRHTFTFRTRKTFPSGVTQILLFRMYGANKYCYISQPRLEIGAIANEYKEGFQWAGIDMTRKGIRATADNFEIQNSSGQRTFYIDSDGNIVGAGNASFAGNLSGAGGTFAGTLSAGVTMAQQIYSAGQYMIIGESYPFSGSTWRGVASRYSQSSTSWYDAATIGALYTPDPNYPDDRSKDTIHGRLYLGNNTIANNDRYIEMDGFTGSIFANAVNLGPKSYSANTTSSSPIAQYSSLIIIKNGCTNVYLPSSPREGEMHLIRNASGATIRIYGNGKDIDTWDGTVGTSSFVGIDNRISVFLFYDGTRWYVNRMN